MYCTEFAREITGLKCVAAYKRHTCFDLRKGRKFLFHTWGKKPTNTASLPLLKV